MTCSDEYFLSQIIHMSHKSNLHKSLWECKEMCDKDERCAYFFMNTDEWCATYKSCHQTRIPKLFGSTYKKHDGNCLQLYISCFLSRLVLFF